MIANERKHHLERLWRDTAQAGDRVFRVFRDDSMPNEKAFSVLLVCDGEPTHAIGMDQSRAEAIDNAALIESTLGLHTDYSMVAS